MAEPLEVSMTDVDQYVLGQLAARDREILMLRKAVSILIQRQQADEPNQETPPTDEESG